MRVITGIAKGRRLCTVPGTNIVRPTSDKVKESIFSAIQFDLEGRRVLDLFAGSGQLGIEALSRGAQSAVFIDCSPASLDVVNRNLSLTGLCENAKVVKSDYSSYLLRTYDVFDIAFLDPPYNAGILIDALEKTITHMSDFGTIFCEHPADKSLPESVSDFSISRVYRFGSIMITMYKRDIQNDE